MRRLSDIFEEKDLINIDNEIFTLEGSKIPSRVNLNIIALGDVGGTVAIALKLLGGDVLNSLGLYDVNENASKRYEMELNQISSIDYPIAKVIGEEDIFNCDIFVFCASLAVPKIGHELADVRMVQFEKNKKLVESYVTKAIEKNFKGKFFIVSDPVDPLCKVALLSGIKRENLRGFGLGVMNARAIYFSKKSNDKKINIYPLEGRAFGPHGEGLVIANSINSYDNEASVLLTRDTINSNLVTRGLGFKPYIAPAISSGALSILNVIRGEYSYSSIYFGKEKEGAFFGCRNKEISGVTQVENLKLPNKLFERIEKSYINLRDII